MSWLSEKGNMNQLIYNASMAVGTALVTAGTAMIWGTGYALLVCGATVLAATVITLAVAR